MSAPISNKSSELIARAERGLAGLEFFKDTFNPQGVGITELQNAKDTFSEKLQAQKDALAEAERATQELYEAKKHLRELLKRLRDAVYSYFGKYDARILKFGLDTLPKRRKKGSASENGAE